MLRPILIVPSISINLHAKSTAMGVGSFETLCDTWSNMAHTTIVTVEAVNIPNPCIENTAAMKAPQVLLLVGSAQAFRRPNAKSSNGAFMLTLK